MIRLRTRTHSHSSPTLRRGFFYALLSISLATAADLHISGIILDAQTGQPLSHVHISIPDLNLTTTSDDQGHYIIHPDRAGTHMLYFDHLGYAPAKKPVALNPRFSTTVHISLQSQLIKLPAVHVVAENLTNSLVHTGNQLIVRKISPGDRALRSDLSTLLESMPEVDLTQPTPGAAPRITLRGSTSAQVLILLNGIPLRSVSAEQTDISQIPLSMVTRVEIAAGNQSAEFGDQAMGGVINIITASQFNSKSNEIHLGSGSFETRNFQYSLQFKSNRVNTLGSYNYENAANNYPYLHLNQSLIQENAQYTKHKIFLSLSAQPGQHTLLQLTGISGSEDQGLPGPLYEQSPTARQYLHTSILNGTLRYQPGDWQLATDFSYHGSHQTLSAETGIYPGYEKIYDSENIHWGVSASYLHSNNLHIRAKLENNRAWLNGQDLLVPRFSLNQQHRNSTEATLSIDQPIQLPKLASTLTTHLTVHHYDVDYHGSDATWNASLKHEFKITGLSLISWYRTGTAYKLPSFWQMFWVSSAFAEGNPNLKPEQSRDQEAGLRVALGQMQNPWISFTAYEQDYLDLITWQRGFGNRYYPVNLESATVSGLSLSTGFNLLKDHLQVTTNHNLTKAINTTPEPNAAGNYLPFRPLGSSSLNLDTQFAGLQASISYRQQRRTYIREANTKWLEPFQEMDLACSYSYPVLTLDVTTTLKINNVTDEQYEVLERYPMPGRHSEINFNLKF